MQTDIADHFPCPDRDTPTKMHQSDGPMCTAKGSSIGEVKEMQLARHITQELLALDGLDHNTGKSCTAGGNHAECDVVCKHVQN